MAWVAVTPPAAEPLTVADVRARLGLGADIVDATITSWIKSARQRLDGPEGELGRALITQTWDHSLDVFPPAVMDADYWRRDRVKLSGPVWSGFEGIPLLPPVQSITSVSYVDTAGSTQTVAPGDYRLIQGDRPLLAPIRGGSWPSTYLDYGAITVRMVSGYGASGASVPEPILTAMILRISIMRGLYQQNPFVRSENVYGVSSTDYVVGAGASDAVEAEVSRLLGRYRVSPGIS